jgi:hypothetical protein
MIFFKDYIGELTNGEVRHSPEFLIQKENELQEYRNNVDTELHHIDLLVLEKIGITTHQGLYIGSAQ